MSTLSTTGRFESLPVQGESARDQIATTIADAERLATHHDSAHADAVTLSAIDRLATHGAGRVGAVGFSFGAAWALWCPAHQSAVAFLRQWLPAE